MMCRLKVIKIIKRCLKLNNNCMIIQEAILELRASNHESRADYAITHKNCSLFLSQNAKQMVHRII